jgi:hypothetical protein
MVQGKDIATKNIKNQDKNINITTKITEITGFRRLI